MGEKTVRGCENVDANPEVGESYLIDALKPVPRRFFSRVNSIATIRFGKLLFCVRFILFYLLKVLFKE
jgi:hypothetical protein